MYVCMYKSNYGLKKKNNGGSPDKGTKDDRRGLQTSATDDRDDFVGV